MSALHGSFSPFVSVEKALNLSNTIRVILHTIRGSRTSWSAVPTLKSAPFSALSARVQVLSGGRKLRAKPVFRALHRAEIPRQASDGPLPQCSRACDLSALSGDRQQYRAPVLSSPCNYSIPPMVRSLAIRPYLWIKQRRLVKTKDPTMSTQPQFKTPTPAEVQNIIQQAHRMRSEYLANSIKSGLSNLHGVFAHQKPIGNAPA